LVTHITFGMNSKTFFSGFLAVACSGLTASACILQVRVACPNDTTAAGIRVCVDGVGCAVTDPFGVAVIDVGNFGTFNVCVDPTSLPAGASLNPSCQKIKVVSDAPPLMEFALSGAFCSTPPAQGPCWLTGGGTIGKGKGTPDYSFGGVVYPGCSPTAAGGGNWNVVDHASGLHFQGQEIIVDSCSGVSTKSPRVNVNIIDFHGVGIIGGIGGNPDATIPVSFVGRAIDNLESGGGADMLFIKVTDASNAVVLNIGTSPADPMVISTGNLQIHTTGCNK
jgi:hypothetical protein